MFRTPVILLIAIPFVAFTLAGCGDSDGGDVDGSVDVAVIDVRERDPAETDATGNDAARDGIGGDAREGDASEGDANEADGGFGATLLTANIGGNSETFTVAKFGLNLSGTLRFELYGGASDDCPEMDSPTPERTLIIASVEPALGERPVGATSLLDFAGTLTDEPILRATGGTVNLVTVSDEQVRFQAMVSFSDGTIEGDGTASHCRSLDER